MNSTFGNLTFVQLLDHQIGFVVIVFIAASLTLLWAAFFVWRYRVKVLTQTGGAGHVCPRCRTSLRRVHRYRWERMMCKLLKLPLGRYRCTNRHCSWQGLQRVSHGSRHPSPSDPFTLEHLERMASGNSALDINLYGTHIETGAVQPPDDGLRKTDQAPAPELENETVLET